MPMRLHSSDAQRSSPAGAGRSAMTQLRSGSTHAETHRAAPMSASLRVPNAQYAPDKFVSKASAPAFLPAPTLTHASPPLPSDPTRSRKELTGAAQALAPHPVPGANITAPAQPSKPRDAFAEDIPSRPRHIAQAHTPAAGQVRDGGAQGAELEAMRALCTAAGVTESARCGQGELEATEAPAHAVADARHGDPSDGREQSSGAQMHKNRNYTDSTTQQPRTSPSGVDAAGLDGSTAQNSEAAGAAMLTAECVLGSHDEQGAERAQAAKRRKTSFAAWSASLLS